MMGQVDKSAHGMVSRIIGTIVTLAVFLIGTLIYVGFYTNGYSLFQKIVVFLVGFILAIAVVSIMWVAWAGRRGWIHERWGP
jgi:hypothetical protein